MYNFLSSNFKRRAFAKALSEIKKEGYYIDLNEDLNSATISPDIQREIAELSEGSSSVDAKNQIEEQTVDVLELGNNKMVSAEEQPTQTAKVNNNETANQSKSGFYEDVFKDQNTFKSGTQIEEVELLEKNPQEDSKRREPSSSAADDSIRQKMLNSINEQVYHNMQRRLEEHRKQLLSVKEESQDEQINKTLDSDVNIKQAVQVAANSPKTAKKPRKTGKRKRKFDADISGGFNF